MVESTPPNPNSLVPPSSPADPPPPLTPSSGGGDGGGGFFLGLPRRPKIRVTTEYDSDTSLFLNKVSTKLLDSLAKLKLCFLNNQNGQISQPQVSFVSKYLSLHYDVESHDGFLTGSFDVAPGLTLKATQDIKFQQGEVAMIADLAGPAYKLELSSAVPSVGLPRATLKFPLGEVSLEEREEDEEEAKRMLSVNGVLKGHVLNGLCTALYTNESLNLSYCYKDDQMSFIPLISLPSNALSFAFKRRFTPSDKLSYWYNLDSNTWSTVYKHTVGKDYKFKAGYDSKERLSWASLWVGEEGGKAKEAPMKMKVQFMLQVPQEDIGSSVFLFRVKKRWDI